MRSAHKARELRRDAALELVLEHHRGAEILAASGGDAEHALRIIEELKARAPSAQVIRLPTEPILRFDDVIPVDPDDEPHARGVDWVVAIGLGLVAWAIIAAIAYAAYRLVEAFA